jgi:pimeloyl-ACP methyl ester carboxylesterase
MTTHYLERPTGKIAYDDAGGGPLVICVPSMGDLRGEFRFLISQIIAAGYRVISVDVRGHGDTSVTWPDYSISGIGSDLVALIRSLDAGPAVIIGTSMAGAAVWAAAEAPELVSGMILIGPFVRGGGNWLLGLFLSLLFSGPWGPAMWLRYYSSLYPTRKPDDFSQYTATLRANLKERGRMKALRHMIRASKAASEERLPRVTAPVLVIMGSKDRDFKNPETEAKWVANSVHGEYKILRETGHYPHAEMPGETGMLVLPFLQMIKETRKRNNDA